MLDGVLPSPVSQALTEMWALNELPAKLGLDTCSGVNVVTIDFLLHLPRHKQPVVHSSAYSVVGGGGKMTVLGAVELQVALPTQPAITEETTQFLVVDWLPHTVDALLGRVFTKRHDMIIHERDDQVEFRTITEVQASGLSIPEAEQYCSTTNPETKPVSFYAQYKPPKRPSTGNSLPSRKQRAT